MVQSAAAFRHFTSSLEATPWELQSGCDGSSMVLLMPCTVPAATLRSPQWVRLTAVLLRAVSLPSTLANTQTTLLQVPPATRRRSLVPVVPVSVCVVCVLTYPRLWLICSSAAQTAPLLIQPR